MEHEVLTIIGMILTLAIFIITQWLSNSRFKRKQENSNVQFQTETQLRLAEFNKELATLKENIQLNKNEINQAYQKYKEETLNMTTTFRTETLASLKDNKEDHTQINVRLGLVMEDLAFIKGKLSGDGSRVRASKL